MAIRSAQINQLLSSHPAIAKDLGDQAGSDRVTRMHRNDCGPTVCMAKEVVARSDSNNLKSSLFQGRDDLATGECPHLAHRSTVI
jgi:hypothetical protein